jgi:hypothetical protein
VLKPYQSGLWLVGQTGERLCASSKRKTKRRIKKDERKIDPINVSNYSNLRKVVPKATQTRLE